jgi:hypothetical protein
VAFGLLLLCVRLLVFVPLTLMRLGDAGTLMQAAIRDPTQWLPALLGRVAGLLVLMKAVSPLCGSDNVKLQQSIRWLVMLVLIATWPRSLFTLISSPICVFNTGRRT